MPAEPEAIKDALSTLREAYADQCHAAADVVIEQVRAGTVTSDMQLWDAITGTFTQHMEDPTLVPRWAPLMFSSYWFDGPPAPIEPYGKMPERESDVIWEYCRIAWVVDVCDVLVKHHGMAEAGTTRKLFLICSPLDSLTDRNDTVRRIIQELRELAVSTADPLGEELRRQADRLDRAHPNLNPSPSRERRR